MPLYSFRHRETGEVHNDVMSYDSKLKFLEENPEYEGIITSAPALCDPVRVSTTKVDREFNDVLKKVKGGYPGSTINEHY